MPFYASGFLKIGIPLAAAIGFLIAPETSTYSIYPNESSSLSDTTKKDSFIA
jgi:hypothetical protein